MENIDQPPADTGTVSGWIRNLPAKFPDVNEGAMEEMMSLTLRYFEEVRKAAGPYQDASSVLELLELHQRFILWKDGVSGLDRKLEDNPAVRVLVVSELAALVLTLSTGMTLFTPECQRTLFDRTNRVLEQASKLALFHLKHPASCPPLDILGFCNSKKEIKSRIDNLYHLLSTIQHLVENFDETEPRQAEEIGVGEGWPLSDSHINRARRRISQTFKQLRSTITHASKSSRTSHGAKNSRKPHSNPSKSSTKKSNGSADPSSISTIFSDSGTYDSANPLTDTVTSNSPSEVEKSRLSARKSDGMALDPDQFVRIWHRNGQDYKEFRIGLIDSGADKSFIRRSIVEELELETTRIAPTTLSAFNGHPFTVSERVQPKWQFHIGSRRHQEFPFFVVSEIPGGRDMLLGNIARKCLGIEFCYPGALVAHEDYEDHSTLAQQQQLHERQRRDTTASQAKMRQNIAARRAQMVRKRAAADAVTEMEQSNSESQEDATRSGNNQG